MDFLTLSQKLRMKCRVIGSGPTAVTGQNAEYERLLSYINEAWLYLQRMHHDWRWMRKTATATTVTGQHLYSPSVDFGLTDFAYWALNYSTGDTFRNYVTAQGNRTEIFMVPIGYDEWRDKYLYGALRYAYTRPIECALAPDNSLAVGPVPVEGYTLYGDYYSAPYEMVLATDTPDMPEQFHWAIIYKAMMFYGASEAAPEVYDDGKQEFDRIVAQLEQAQGPYMTLNGAIA